MTPSELKYNVDATGSKFFSRENMKFAGDTMKNYGVRSKPQLIDVGNDQQVLCWVLYRRKPVKHGMQKDAYFNNRTFKQVHAKI
jgi:hypothetical protein